MLLNDDKLILQIQHGNTACANELVERYYYIYIYERKGSFKAYLYTIAHHLCIDENRKNIASELDDNLPIEDRRLRQIEDRDEINSLLNLLTPMQREAVLLHCGEQLSFREISQILDIPARTVQSRVRAALSILRKENR